MYINCYIKYIEVSQVPYKGTIEKWYDEKHTWFNNSHISTSEINTHTINDFILCILFIYVVSYEMGFYIACFVPIIMYKYTPDSGDSINFYDDVYFMTCQSFYCDSLFLK